MAAHNRAQARLELSDVIGLYEIVVGPGFEAVDAILDRRASGEHQDRNAVADPTQRLADLDAVDVGQPEVEHDRVGDVRLRAQQALLARGRFQDLIATEQQRAPDRRPDRIVVLDHQDPHLLSREATAEQAPGLAPACEPVRSACDARGGAR